MSGHLNKAPPKVEFKQNKYKVKVTVLLAILISILLLCLPSCERKPYILYHNFRTVDVAFPQLVTGQIRNQTRVLGYFELGVTVTPSHFIIRNN